MQFEASIGSEKPHYASAKDGHSRSASQMFLASTAFQVERRSSIAFEHANADRLEDALDYAEAALRNFETFGAGAAEDIEKTKRLIEEIKKALAAQGG